MARSPFSVTRKENTWREFAKAFYSHSMRRMAVIIWARLRKRRYQSVPIPECSMLYICIFLMHVNDVSAVWWQLLCTNLKRHDTCSYLACFLYSCTRVSLCSVSTLGRMFSPKENQLIVVVV